ncbi:MAG: hypothetical protein EZS28_010090 [Streblomastix strix]|uniref:Uncharacterized protein n=1 Tax=Streblomastix strix TaxID=222440 RepID=A0A5J4WI79_9EUKA|nr:MAG: hypothetical protein EZS28_010090 [Streblomastix strix]
MKNAVSQIVFGRQQTWLSQKELIYLSIQAVGLLLELYHDAQWLDKKYFVRLVIVLNYENSRSGGAFETDIVSAYYAIDLIICTFSNAFSSLHNL